MKFLTPHTRTAVLLVMLAVVCVCAGLVWYRADTLRVQDGQVRARNVSATASSTSPVQIPSVAASLPSGSTTTDVAQPEPQAAVPPLSPNTPPPVVAEKVSPAKTVPQPVLEKTVDDRLRITAPLSMSIEVQDMAGKIVGVSMYPFCVGASKEGASMLAELCGDDCDTQADRDELTTYFCEGPQYVREELPNSSYVQSSLHQVGFGFYPEKVGDLYTVRLTAFAPDTAYLTLADGTDHVLSDVQFPVQEGTVAEYRIVYTAEGTVDVEQIQLDVDGDGTVDRAISHVGV